MQDEPIDDDLFLPEGEEDNLDLDLPHCGLAWSIELSDSITAIALAPNRLLVAVATIDDEITLLDIETGKVTSTLPGHSGGTNALQFLNDEILISTGEDSLAKIWRCSNTAAAASEEEAKEQLTKPQLVVEYNVAGIDADRSFAGYTVGHLAMSPDGDQFAVASGKSIVLFTITDAVPTNLDITRRDLPPLKSTVEALKFDAHNANLLAAYNGGITMWALATRKDKDQAQALDFAYDGACLAIEANKDMSWLCAGCHDASVHIWHLLHPDDDSTSTSSEGVAVREMACGGYQKPVKMVEFGPGRNSKWLASAGGLQGTIWDFSDSPAGSVPTLTLGHVSPITCQAWQPEEPYLLVTGSKNGLLLFHDVNDIAQPGKPNLCLPGVVADAFSTSEDGSADGKDEENEQDEATVVMFGREGVVVSGHVSGVVRGWRLPEGEEEEEETDDEETDEAEDKR